MPGASVRSAVSCLAAGLWLALLGATFAHAGTDTERAQGERLFRAQCVGCHSIEPGVHLAGPSLHGVVGRPAGSLTDFDYSSVLREADLVWNRDTLDAFLAGPDDFLPGTRMVLWGLDERTRGRIIDYLVSESGER
ncbi:c-type cytochrome [Billgrantia pellis]|uniref:C-type cytochrome n=1 Tax=Billgrantia pellis TaxID=2606936 RepID=A0A7V7KGE6_9GAMM|nr:c-type cytochrome [Halomonas pellis]KAA0009660.1 c-type cytochrome [Halomonas pellis]